MKKTLIIFSCAISLFFVGCASNKPNEDFTDSSEISAPDIQDSLEDNSEEDALNDEPLQSSEEQDNITQDSEAETTENDIENTIEENKNFFDELEDIDEPVVITLDPPLIEEGTDDDEEGNSEFLELVESDLPAEELLEELDTTESETVDDNSSDSDTNITDTDNTDTSIDEINEEDSEDTDLNDNTEDVIDITDDDASAIDDFEEKVIEEIIPSRKVTLKKFEYLDITYPGNGWVFMGLTDGSKDLTYFGRKLGTGETKFTLQAKNPGTKIIHFYKEDNLTAQTLDDYIEVEILNEKGSNKDHISAPEYKLPVTKKAKEIIDTNKKKEALKNEIETKEEDNSINNQNNLNNLIEEKNTKTVEPEKETKKVIKAENAVIPSPETEQPKKSEQETKTVDSKLLLKEAQLLYNEKEYSAANRKLDEFFEFAVSNRDEGLFLKGNILEAKSEIQNIKAAIEAYTTLTKNYPASKYWDDANKRIIYLKRFYLEVR